MKNIVIVSMLFLGMLFCSCCKSSQSSSWETYCDKYGVDVDEPTRGQELFYLDCYAGSVEEENDLNLMP